MHEKGVWTPLVYEHNNDQDKKKVIRSLLFLKRKRDGSFKDGRMQDRDNG
jgi:hypothetical protein